MSNHLPMTVRVPIDTNNPAIMRAEEKCIKCGQCKVICTEFIGIHDTYTLEQTGDKAICVHCGQCANVCPPSSITEQYEYPALKAAIADKDKIVIFSTSPSVRVALGEEFGQESGGFVQGKMVALLRALGANYVLDTNFAADLTIVEEASELIQRVTKGDRPLPQFTSCCPAWVKYAETYHPSILPHISTAKSPIGMQGPTIKTYFAKKMGLDPSKIVNVAVTPCTAKKFEIRREEMSDAGKHLGIEGMRDMDHVITTRELALWAKEAGIDFAALPDSDYDKLMGEASGAGVIFGNTGGVMEAAVRTAYSYITGKPATEALYNLTPVRGMDDMREATVTIGDLTVKVAVVYGTKTAGKLVEAIQKGEKDYHFIEVMTCPGGCIGGGGQPKGMLEKAQEQRQARVDTLYKRDAAMTQRDSHLNQEIKTLYAEFYGKPLSDLAEKMLHTSYASRSADLGTPSTAAPAPVAPAGAPQPKAGEKTRCTICGYIHEGPYADGFKCPICNQPPNVFEIV